MARPAALILAVLLVASCGGSKRSGRPDGVHEPITFRLVNPSGFDPAYMDWTHEGLTELHGRSLDDSWRFLWFPPPCTMDCADVPEGECACLECEPADPVMRELGPFGEVLVEWEGPDVYTLVEDECGCFCARAEPLLYPGSNVVGLVSYSGYSCPDDCPPHAGLIEGAVPDGSRRCATRIVDLPWEEESLTILMGTVCDSDWP